MCEDDPIELPMADTISDYLKGISDLLSENALKVVLMKRHIAPDTPVWDLSERELDLAEAEVYYQLSNLPVGGATSKDVDGSWSHTEGGSSCAVRRSTSARSASASAFIASAFFMRLLARPYSIKPNRVEQPITPEKICHKISIPIINYYPLIINCVLRY